MSGPGAPLAASIAVTSEPGSPSPSVQAARNVCPDAAAGANAASAAASATPAGSARISRAPRSPRDTARESAREAAHPALAATIEAEYARAVGDDDPALWDAAARAWNDWPTPFRSAYARWRQAEAALARRDRAQAQRALLAAHATAADLGAQAQLSELEALARRGRIALPAGDAEAPADEAAVGDELPAGQDLGLTARELEVLEHVANGETNREIAEALFISVRTAGVHVSHILSKLGASNRVEGAAIAHRLGLAR